MADKYKWDSPAEWLIEYAGKLNATELFNEFTVLVQQLDSDTIQDLYQSEMDAQGYFTPEFQTDKLTSVSYPGEVFTVEEVDGSYQSVYPSALSDLSGIYPTPADAWREIKAQCEERGITLTGEAR